MEHTAKSLLHQAQANAAPNNRRIATQLFLVALGVVGLTVAAAALSHFSQELQNGRELINAAFMWSLEKSRYLANTVLAAIVFSVSVVWAMAKSMSGFFGLAMCAAGLLVLNAWYRSRRYVMQAALDLALANDLPAAEGTRLLKSFAKTHTVVTTTTFAVALFAVVQALVFLLRPMAIPFTEVAAYFVSLKPVLAAGWLLVWNVSMRMVNSQVQLTSSQVSAYALFQGCGMAAQEFLESLSRRNGENCTVDVVLARLQRMGLFQANHQDTCQVLTDARSLAQNALARSS